jgi:hypothetical protein
MSVLLPAGQITPHFSVAEMSCPCCGFIVLDNARHVCEELERVRIMCGPLQILSASRCLKYNVHVGGQINSYHLNSLAADIGVGRDADRYRLVQVLLVLNWFGIGVGNAMVHADRRQRVLLPQARVMWAYPLGA